MACKILINIAAYIKEKSEKENAAWGRELLMRILEVNIRNLPNQEILVPYWLITSHVT